MLTRTKLVLLTVGLVLSTVIALGTVGWLGYRELARSERALQLEWEIDVEAARLREAIHEIVSDARLLAGLPVARAILKDTADGKSAGAQGDDLATLFEQTIRAKVHYAQLRLIARDGGERVRVHRVGDRTLHVPDGELQSKAGRRYVEEPLQLLPGSIYLSRVTLNREHGEIVSPHEPMLRVVSPVGVGDRTTGIVVINVRFDQWIDSLLRSTPLGYRYSIANEDGDYVYHPDAGMTFGFDLGARHRIQDDYRDFDDDSSANEPSAVTGELVAGRRIRLGEEATARQLSLAVAAAPELVSAPADRMAGWGLLWTLFLVALAIGASYALAHHLTRPLMDIGRIAESMAERRDGAELPIDRKDEIGSMARALDHMITSLRKSETDLSQTNVDLTKKNEDLEHFTHLASHDLREPIRRMGMAADVLRRTQADRLDEEGQRAFGYLVAAADRAEQLIDGFRTLARIGHSSLHPESLELDELVSDVLSSLDDVDKRRLSITVRPLPRIVGYPILLRILFHNLIENARKHSRGDDVTIEIGSLPAADGPADEAMENVVLFVRNSAASVSHDALSSVFSPFFGGPVATPDAAAGSDDGGAAGATAVPANRGLGLGLSICRKVVEKHDGRIWMESGRDWVQVSFTLATDALSVLQRAPCPDYS